MGASSAVRARHFADGTRKTVKIRNVHFVGGLSSFFFDDQLAIKRGADQDGFMYRGKTLTPGFDAVRQAGECVSVILELEDGNLAVGDCAAVQYSGAGGRDPLFRAEHFIPFMQTHLRPLLLGRDVSRFIDNARWLDTLHLDGTLLHTAIRYGVSQALLEATAIQSRCLKAEVLCTEYDLPVVTEPVPLFGQSGDDRYQSVDKMIVKRVDALPHGLINNVATKLGHQGELLLEYVTWLARRIRVLHPGTDYRPDLHIDVYGTVGQLFEQDTGQVAAYLARLGEAAGEFSLFLEGPVDAGGKNAQIEALSTIRERLSAMGSTVRLVADEWCNTYQDVIDFTDAACCDMVQIKTPDLGSIHNVVEAVRYCHGKGMGAYQGGTCNETDVSARACVHLALAARPTRMLVKPGMGFDEGMTIVGNEMFRSLAVMRARQ